MNQHISSKTTPKDFFLYLGITVALYVAVAGFLALVFGVINEYFADSLIYYYGPSGINGGIAMLVVVFPVYLLLSWFAHRDLVATPDKGDMWVRRWLVFLTLFLAGIALVIDLVTLILVFLEGEATTRFVLKVLVVLGVAGSVFGYYLASIRGALSGRHKKLCAWMAGVVVLIAVILGFVIAGSPGEQRSREFDGRRTNDLRNIQYEVVEYWQERDVLPESIDALEDSLGYFIAPTDPETDAAYEYRVTGELSFELCATFDITNREKGPRPTIGGPYDRYGVEQIWEHDAGYYCFDRTIDPEFHSSENF